jgi:hypothetical protein
VLKRDGYTTPFCYAGHGKFDFLKNDASHNGWDHLVERGVEEMQQPHATETAFLIIFLTVTRHRSFTYTAVHPRRSQRRQVRAYRERRQLGARLLFARARKARFLNNILVVIADHGTRVDGRQIIPLKSDPIP